MRAFKTKVFRRFADKEDLTDEALALIVERAERGLIDADLGGGVIKQRIPRIGEGRSGGYRSIILFRSGHLAIFVFGYPKNERENISRDDLCGFRELADRMLAYTKEQISIAVETGALVEVNLDEENL